MSITKSVAALLCAVAIASASAVPARAADVQVNIGVPPLLSVQPPLVAVPPVPQVQYAPEAPYDVFYYGGQYYTYQNGWFRTRQVGNPWVAVQRVPRQVLVVPAKYYKVPPGHLKKHKHHKGDNDD